MLAISSIRRTLATLAIGAAYVAPGHTLANVALATYVAADDTLGASATMPASVTSAPASPAPSTANGPARCSGCKA